MFRMIGLVHDAVSFQPILKLIEVNMKYFPINVDTLSKVVSRGAINVIKESVDEKKFKLMNDFLHVWFRSKTLQYYYFCEQVKQAEKQAMIEGIRENGSEAAEFVIRKVSNEFTKSYFCRKFVNATYFCYIETHTTRPFEMVFSTQTKKIVLQRLKSYSYIVSCILSTGFVAGKSTKTTAQFGISSMVIYGFFDTLDCVASCKKNVVIVIVAKDRCKKSSFVWPTRNSKVTLGRFSLSFCCNISGKCAQNILHLPKWCSVVEHCLNMKMHEE